MIAPLIGFAATLALPFLVFCLIGILVGLDPLSLATVLLVYGYGAVRVWRWLTAKNDPTDLDVLAPRLNRGVPSEAPVQRTSARTSLDDVEEDDEAMA
jgi:hypothetical protein